MRGQTGQSTARYKSLRLDRAHVARPPDCPGSEGLEGVAICVWMATCDVQYIDDVVDFVQEVISSRPRPK